MAKPSFWARYKDLVNLLAGACIALASSFIATSQQTHFQRNQALAEKRFAVLRELVEANNEAWRKIDADLESAAAALEAASTRAEDIENTSGTLREVASRFGDEFTSLIDPIVKTWNADSREYDSRMESLTTLLAYLTNRDPVDLKIDMQFRNHAKRIETLVDELTAGLGKAKTKRDLKAAVKSFIDGTRNVIVEVRTDLQSQRTRVNGDIKKIATALLMS